MKILLYLSVSIFLCAGSFAQEGFKERRLPSQFNKFIERPSITWAMQSFDSLRFTTLNFSSLLRTRVLNNEIRISTQIGNGNYGKIVYSNMFNLYHYRFGISEPAFSENTDFKAFDVHRREVIKKEYDTASTNLIYIDEIFYSDNGKLSIYIPYVSPAYPVNLSSGIFLGNALYFTSSFNFRYKYKGKKKDKTILLGSSAKTIVTDSVDKKNVLKQLYGKNLLESIWEDLTTNHKIFRFTDNKEVTKTALSMDLPDNEKIDVPVYDANGNLTGAIVRSSRNLLPVDFNKLEIKLEWKYNPKRDIVISEIKEVYLYMGFHPQPTFKIVW